MHHASAQSLIKTAQSQGIHTQLVETPFGVQLLGLWGQLVPSPSPVAKASKIVNSGSYLPEFSLLP